MDKWTYLPGILIILLLVWVIYRRAEKSELYFYFWTALLIKCVAGAFLGWLYFHYYESGDTISYFHDAMLLRGLALSDLQTFFTFLWTDSLPQDYLSELIYYTSSPRALFFTKILTVLNLLFLDHYYLIAIFISILSFAGFYILAQQLASTFKAGKNAAVVALLFVPSVLLWTSGMIKESLTMSCMAYLLATLLRDSRTKKFMPWWQWILSLLCIVVIWKLKYYYAAVLTPTLVISWLIYKLSNYSAHPALHRFRILTWAILLLISFVGISFSQINLQLNRLPEVIKLNHDAYVDKSTEGDFIRYGAIDPTWTSIAQNAPLALWSGLARPFFGDTNTGFKWFSALENSAMLLLLLWNLPNIRKGILSENGLWMVAGIAYVVFLAIFLSQSTPNLGTLTRYKAGFFFMYAYLILYNHPIFATLEQITKWKNR